MRISRRSGLLVSGIATALAASVMLAPVQAADSSTATSLADFGGLAGLEAKCKEEGQLNVIALPRDWANYGEVIDTFIRKYPEVNLDSQNPEASSAQELAAVRQLKGSNRSPDVVDVGLPFAVAGAAEGLWAPYKVATWNDIPAGAKEKTGLYYSDYGGVIAIGYDANKVKVAPKSIKDLANPRYKNQVALNGNPSSASAARNGLFAISYAYAGGKKGLDDITYGVDAIKAWKKAGTFLPVQASSATVANGQTPITLDWDYLQDKYAKSSTKVKWKKVIPSEVAIGGYYQQAVVKTAPNPACARLWMEYLYSDQAQNLWLAGGARPIRLDAMQKAGTANKKYVAGLPKLPAGVTVVYPTLKQQTDATAKLGKLWGKLN
ncbi:MAG: ABC transporter substrate-binding protein [Candidatus Nanopelagicales bacterium]